MNGYFQEYDIVDELELDRVNKLSDQIDKDLQKKLDSSELPSILDNLGKKYGINVNDLIHKIYGEING